MRGLVGDPNPMPGALGMVVPHAGMVYSGRTAGMAYRRAPEQPQTLVLCAPSHRAYLSGAVLPRADALGTPLGPVSVDPDAAARLEARGLPRMDIPEHSLEVQLPFIRHRYPGVRVVPLILGSHDPRYPGVLAQMLHDLVPGGFFIASSDLSHFHTLETARRLDSRVREAFLSLDPERFAEALASGGEACGSGPMAVLLHYSRLSGATGAVEVHYSTSADAGGSTEEVVGYFSAMVLKEGDREC